MKIPEFIITQFGDKYRIVDFKDDCFILEENPYLVSYHIKSDDFLWYQNGFVVPAGLKAEDNQKYLDWLEENNKK